MAIKPTKQTRPLRFNSFMRYSSMAMQMGATIFLGVWGGMKLDERFSRSFPWFTLILSLSSVVLAIYMVLRDFIKKNPQ